MSSSSKKPSLIPRPINPVKGRRKGRSPSTAKITSAGSVILPHLGSSTLSTIAHNDTEDSPSIVCGGGSISQGLTQSSVNQHRRTESSRPIVSASSLQTSLPTTSVNRGAFPEPPICSTATINACDRNTLDNIQDPLGPSHSPQALPLQASWFEGAHNFQMGDFISHVSVFNEMGTQQSILEIQRAQLNTLPKHPAMSTKRAEYLPNSRQPDVDKLCEREATSTDLVLCIHGPAGIGKSTLAGHLTDEFRDSGRLAAAIFLGFIPTEMSEPETIVKMIGHEIGCIHPGAIPKIVEAMDRCHGAPLETYLHRYIVEPLRSLGDPRPLIVIIDALDEWHNHQTFLKALAALNSESSIVRFFLTGRLNPCAYHSPGIDNVSIYTYPLGPISKEAIKAYFHKHLATVPWVDGRKALPEDVEKLTELSCGLPVWASTVVALLSHRFSNSPPHEILAEIVGSRRQLGGGEGLGVLYHNGLMRLFTSSTDQEYFRRHMGAISALQAPVSQANFSRLTGIPSHLIPHIQISLSAVQIRSPPPGSEKMVHPASTLHHLSFLEYLQAPTTDSSFGISTYASHSTISLACTEQLSSLPSSPEHSNIRLRALQRYAVKYSLHHISNGTLRSKDPWLQSLQSSALEAMSDTDRRQWAALFLREFMPEEVDSMLENIAEGDSMVWILRELANWLSVSGGDHWGFQVACLEVAVRMDGDDAEAWWDLGRCYERRGRETRTLRLHEEAVIAFRHALRLRPEPHPGRGASFHGLACGLLLCHQQNGDLNVLNESISCYRMAVKLSPVPHSGRARNLRDLSDALNNLYDHNGDLEILDEVVSLRRETLELCPATQPDHAWSLDRLATALAHLFLRNGDTEALDEAIVLHRKALVLRPPSHGDRAWSLNNLAAALTYLHQRTGDVNTLMEFISLFREALMLRPAPHPDRSSPLHNLADSLWKLHQLNKDRGTLDECISLVREALTLHPAPHPYRQATLRVLAQAYLSRFEEDRTIEVLDEAISMAREGLALCPPGHRCRIYHVREFVGLLQRRREFTGDDRDCEEIEDWEAELDEFCDLQASLRL